jgi:hypothetical protein
MAQPLNVRIGLLLLSNGNATADDLSEALGTESAHIRKAITSAIKLCRVKPDGDGYILTEGGRKFFQSLLDKSKRPPGVRPEPGKPLPPNGADLGRIVRKTDDRKVSEALEKIAKANTPAVFETATSDRKILRALGDYLKALEITGRRAWIIEDGALVEVEAVVLP